MKRCFALSMVVLGALLGCDAKEDVKTVDWYVAHQAERVTMLDRCKANPGELSLTPNCINASQAESLVDGAKRKGLNVRPLEGVRLGGGRP